MSHIKAFFFDLDGTLVDTHEANYLAYQEAIISTLGVEATEDLRALIRQGKSSHEFLPQVISGIDIKAIEAINKSKSEVYKNFAQQSRPNDYLIDFVRSISRHHITALVTTAKQKNAETILKLHNLENYFSFTVFGDEVARMKPDPEAYLLAIKKSGVKTSEILAFEDSDKGITAAEAAGLKVVHVKDFI